MKTFKQLSGVVSLATLAAMPATAAVTLYDNNNTTVKADVFLNTFYVNSKDDVSDKSESRIKIGFLPNILGFNFATTTANGLKLGGRTSFWSSSSDSRRRNQDDGPSSVQTQNDLTDGHIDTRQVYGTVEGDFGEILFGKDFGLFGRSNIFGDELLLGFGNNSLFIENSFVSYGNIGSGYLYPVPTSQITWRSKDLFGKFKVALGIHDPEKLAGNGQSEEKAPRFEGELTYDFGFGNAWLGFASQKSESLVTDEDIHSKGISYGLKLKHGGFSVTASGFSGEGLGAIVNTAQVVSGVIVDSNGDERDSSGFLGQASYSTGGERFVVSYGHNEVDGDPGADDFYDSDVTSIAWFHNITKSGSLKLVTEYSTSEVELSGTKAADVKSLAMGLVLTF